MSAETITYNHTSAPAQFVEALTTHGVVVVLDHPTDLTHVLKTHSMWEEFFASEEKVKYGQSEEPSSGYFAVGSHPSYAQECYQYYPWAPNPQGMNQATQKLFDHYSHLSNTFLEWIESEMPKRLKTQLSKPLVQMVANSQNANMCMIHRGDHAAMDYGVPKARDEGLLTLMLAGPYEQFKFWDVHTKQWREMKCPQGSLLVNAGSVLDTLTEGLYTAASHAQLGALEEGGPLGLGCILPFFSKPA
jgi:isopenicillin N synthase-like dioxygenase